MINFDPVIGVNIKPQNENWSVVLYPSYKILSIRGFKYIT